MATAEEILAAAFASEAIVVDVESRQLIVPSTLEHIGVESDDDVFKVPFILPRFYGDIDLSKFDININYLNAHGQGDVYDVTDAVVSEDSIEFSWLVGRYAAAYAGNVTFNVCLKKYNAEQVGVVDQEFNTMPSVVVVNEGLETGEAVVATHAEVIARLCDYINSFSDRLALVERTVGLGDNYGNSKISFVDGVLIISSGGPGGLEGGSGSGGSGDSGSSGGGSGSGGGETPVIGYNISIRNDTGHTIRIYLNNYSASHAIDAGSVINCSDVQKLLTTDFYASFKFTDANGNAVVLAPDSNGWYTITQDLVVVARYYEDSSRHTLYITSADMAGSLFINNNITTAIPFEKGTTVIGNVSTFILTNAYFKYNGATDMDGSPLPLSRDEDGWYILTQDATVDLKYEVPTVYKTISGKWIFDYGIDLPVGQYNIGVGPIRTGANYTIAIDEIIVDQFGGIIYVNNATQNVMDVIPANGQWLDTNYRYLDFGEEGISVPENVYEWFIVNATPGEYEGTTVTYDLIDCTSSNKATITEKNYHYNAVITATHPDDTLVDVWVTMDGVNITNEVYYSEDGHTGEILIDKVTGPIEIHAYANSNAPICTVTYDTDRVSMNHTYIEFKTGTSYHNSISPDAGYAIGRVQIVMKGYDITSSAYIPGANNKSGEIQIGCVDGDITITASGVVSSNSKISGKWLMNESVDISRSTSSQFTAKTGTNYETTIAMILVFGTGLFYRINGSNVMVAPKTDSENNLATFSSAGYRKVDFGTTEQVVSDEFYAWMLANATKIS